MKSPVDRRQFLEAIEVGVEAKSRRLCQSSSSFELRAPVWGHEVPVRSWAASAGSLESFQACDIARADRRTGHGEAQMTDSGHLRSRELRQARCVDSWRVGQTASVPCLGTDFSVARQYPALGRPLVHDVPIAFAPLLVAPGLSPATIWERLAFSNFDRRSSNLGSSMASAQQRHGSVMAVTLQ